MKKIGEIKESNRLVIEELIEDIVIEKDNNVKIIFKCEDKYFEALDFINRQKCDMIASENESWKLTFRQNGEERIYAQKQRTRGPSAHCKRRCGAVWQ